MKIPKLLTICLVLCCLFSGNVFSQTCQVAINTSISGEVGFCGSGVPASTAEIGDTIVYTVGVSTDLDYCPIEDALASLTLPDGTIVPVPIPSNLPPGYDSSGDLIGVCIASYVVRELDLGQLPVDISPLGTDPTLPNEVRALVTASGTSILGPDPGDTDQAQAAAVRTTRILGEPCIEITKVPFCADPSGQLIPLPDGTDGYSLRGQTITYQYTVRNCGETTSILTPDVGVDSILDSQIGGPQDVELIGEYLSDGCPAVLVPGESCSFDWDYLVPVDDIRDAIENTVVVTGTAQDGTGRTVTDNDDAVVNLKDPSFRIVVDCDVADIVNGTQPFDVEFCNTGDVDLIVTLTDSVPGIPDQFLLPAENLPDEDGCESYNVDVLFTPTGGGANICGQGTGGGIATLTVDATAVIDPVDAPCINDVIDDDADSVNTDTCEVPGIPCPEPSFTVVKTCVTDNPSSDANCVPGGDLVQYEITITNTTPIDVDCITCLAFVVTDLEVGLDNELLPVVVCNGESIDVSEVLQRPLTAQTPECELGQVGVFDMLPNTALVSALCVDNGASLGDPVESNEAICCYFCEGEPEGCTPGFWKNHTDCWCLELSDGTPISPDTPLTAIWGELANPPYDTLDDDDRKSDFDTDTLIDALRYRGGPELAGATRNMLRHATAALLNACSNDVAYPVSVDMIIDLGNAALASEDPATIQELHTVLAGFNEDSPCPIDAHCRVIDDVINGD